MRSLIFIFALTCFSFQSLAHSHQHAMPHEMQHGFVLSADDTHGSHLVATGHHSRQTEIMGHLVIDDKVEKENYETRKLQTNGSSYFLFQAQSLDLRSLKIGQVLTGHIVESQIGQYEPKNVIVKSAQLEIDRVLLNIPNPFFTEEDDLMNNSKPKKVPCCSDGGGKPCKWNC